jgi:hypothetical protein
MTGDEVIELRKLWSQMNFGPSLPVATVLATRDWLAYVQAMADAMPRGETVMFPDEAEVLWAWPDGVCVVFSEPLDVQHAIVSVGGTYGDVELKSEPSYEMQRAAAFVVYPTTLVRTRAPAEPLVSGADLASEHVDVPDEIPARPVMWIAADPTDIITGHWLPGALMHPLHGNALSHSSRLQLSLITALGHRLTRLDAVAGRGERRRVERELPGYRMLQLASGASVQRGSDGGSVEWSKRWMVRGHWRLQPYGPRNGPQQRKAIWIDPYVKGPEDKPLDVRPTVWSTGTRPTS